MDFFENLGTSGFLKMRVSTLTGATGFMAGFLITVGTGGLITCLIVYLST